MVATDRVVLIRYRQGGAERRGSGLLVGGRCVLTADHCANGTDHRVFIGGDEHLAGVLVRSASRDVDLAVLDVPGVDEVEWLRCARVDRTAGHKVGCQVFGFPAWKTDREGRPLRAQVDGYVPTGEGADPAAVGVVPVLPLRITDQQIRAQVPRGDLDAPGSPWAGMSGAVVVTPDDLVVGVVRGHAPAEGVAALTLTPLDALPGLPEERSAVFLAALQAGAVSGWPTLTGTAGPPTRRARVVVGEIPPEPPGFVTRREADELDRALGDPGVCALVGLSGSGKSQIAGRAARDRDAQGWPLVGWVTAADQGGLLAGLARVADAVGVADPDGDSGRSAQRLRDHLQGISEPGLLVLDNVTDPDAVRPFLPTAGAVRVMITSTDAAVGALARHVITVGAFTRGESVGYLTARTGREDPAGADALAAAVGDLPVALAQAASALLGPPPTSYPDLLEELNALPVEDVLGRSAGQDYPRSVGAALLLSIQGAEHVEDGGLTGRVLRVAAVLDPAGIQPALLDRLTPPRPEPVPARRALRAAEERCLARSLLTPVEPTTTQQGQVWVMHRLVARVLRDRDTTDGTLADTAVTALDLVEPELFDEEQAWSRRDDGSTLVGHIQALWGACEHLTDQTDLLTRILQSRSWAVRQLTEAADLTLAIATGTQTLADTERVLGPDHPDTLASRNNLAGAYESAGRLEEAIGLYEQTLTDQQRVLGADHPQTLASRNYLAGAYKSAGRLEEAIGLLEPTLADTERVLGPDHPQTLTSRNNLADAYESAGRLEEAIGLYEQTLTDRQRVLGPDHPDTLGSRNNLAYAYESAGRLEEAIGLYEQTLTDTERILGPTHPLTRTVRGNLEAARRQRLDTPGEDRAKGST
jgi:tetratricopeptide (TPR) repeat protein